MEATPAFAAQLDQNDKLASFRSRFLIPVRNGKEQIYFLGNSLGLQPKSTDQYLQQVLRQWQHYGVEGFFEGEQPWLEMHDQLTSPLAAVVGAKPAEIVVMNSLTVNLHLLMVSFYQPKGKRNKILCEAKAFPSDQYLLETHVRQRGLNPDEVIIEVQPRAGDVAILEEDILAAIQEHGSELALVFWGGVNYYSGQLFHIKNITAAAHAVGALAGFDLAHAAGNVLLQLHDWDVDFAAWCSYKYLNAGPGAIGGCFVHERFHTLQSLQRFAGWWGYKKETRFLMKPRFDPISSAEGWQLSTPAPLLYAAHLASLEIFAAAGMEAILEKARLLNDYLLFLLQQIPQVANGSVTLLTPQNAKGSQLSLLVPENGKEVFRKLTAAGIFADWREPDVIRIAPVPLFNTFSELLVFAQELQKALSPDTD